MLAPAAKAGTHGEDVVGTSRSALVSPSAHGDSRAIAARGSVDFDQRRAHSPRVTRPGDVAESFVAAISRHDPDAVARCFAKDYEDEAPARPGEVVQGRDEVRANFARMFTSMPDVRATIIRLAEREDEAWIEWRLSATRDDGSTMDFVGVNIFGVADGAFRWGRIYTELARSAGGIEAQLARMTGDDARAEG